MDSIQTDTLLNGYKILQDKERFMFGIDAVLLADFAKSNLKPSEKGIDLGTGNGIIPLLLVNQINEIYGLEIQPDSANLATESVKINQLENKIKILQGDIKTVDTILPKHSFDFVVSNPPYMISDHGQHSPTDAKAIARHEVLCNLEDVVSAADYLLKPHGKFFMIHRPFRLPEIFASLNKHRIEPKRIRLICPFISTEPNIVLIEARKNAKPRLKIEPQLTVYEKPGEYTLDIQKIYQNL